MRNRLFRRSGQRRSNSVCFFITALGQCILSYLEFLTRFTTVYAAIKGQPFCRSAHQMHEIFARHTLNTIGVWWIPGFIIGVCTIFIAALWAVTVYLASFLVRMRERISGSRRVLFLL